MRAAHLAHLAAAARRFGSRPRGGPGPELQAAAPHRGRRRHLLRGDRGAAPARPAQRNPRRGDPGRQGVAAVRSSGALGAVGATGTPAANRMAAEADIVIGVGTRYSDFTTGSRTAFQNPDVRFV